MNEPHSCCFQCHTFLGLRSLWTRGTSGSSQECVNSLGWFVGVCNSANQHVMSQTLSLQSTYMARAKQEKRKIKPKSQGKAIFKQIWKPIWDVIQGALPTKKHLCIYVYIYMYMPSRSPSHREFTIGKNSLNKKNIVSSIQAILAAGILARWGPPVMFVTL